MVDRPIAHVLAQVMADVGAVAKGDRNQAQGFDFRGIDAVVNAVGPVLRAHGVLTLPTVEDVHYDQVEVGQKRSLMRQCTLRVRWSFVGPAGDRLEAVVMAEAMDSGDKATSKAHSVAYRTVLLQVLCIPTDEPDPDSSSFVRSEASEEVEVAAGVAIELAAAINVGGRECRRRWLDRFGVPPAMLPEHRLAEARAFLAETVDQEGSDATAEVPA